MINQVSTLRLQDKVLKAKQAVKAAGFASGRFKPNGKSLRVDVIVPVTFEEFDKTQSQLVDHLRVEIAHLVGAEHELAVTPAACPYDLRTTQGKAWRQGQLAGATA